MSRFGILLVFRAANSSIGALFASVFVLFAGNSLLNTLVPLRATLEGFPPIVVGLLGSGYFFGMLSGALVAPAIIARVGFIRAFAAFTALAIACALAYPLLVSTITWVILRVLIGAAFAGIYSVTDSWVNAVSTNANRGQVYAFYQIVNFCGNAIGQQASGIGHAKGFELFSLSAILLAFAIVPLSTTNKSAPERPRTLRLHLLWLMRLSPIGAMTAVVIGAANGCFFALAPVYALEVGGSPRAVSAFMTATVIGSAVMMWPVGRLSDALDRRFLLLVFAFAGGIVEVALWFRLVGAAGQPLMGFAVGATTLVLYTLGSSHANDRGGAENAVEVSTGLLFLYCAGAIVAPTVASALMERYGVAALFGQNAMLHLGLAAFVAWRIWVRGSGQRPKPTASHKLPSLS
jgi:MFS family permease